jgi:D-alanyl-D-alanine carboxypeptidase
MTQTLLPPSGTDRAQPTRRQLVRRRARQRWTKLAAWSAVGLSSAVAIAATVVLLAPGWSAPSGGPSEWMPSLVPGADSDSDAGSADGVILDSEELRIDADIPAITRLEPGLREAVEQAAAAAEADGEDLFITSGWRSVAYQEELFREAVATYGSEEAAREFVAPPERSRHVTGDAVDIGPLDTQFWMIEHGYEYGLCQTYSNERWHFELATTPGGTCPDMLADASADWF